ncbi:hypothetical protein [Halomonas mongoliensis]|uniref:hypothetical protein n=1 Tax=Halomonas mongoliensis TaxID=321265 RepID=UPI00403B18C9
MIDEAPYPHEIRAFWAEAIDTLDLDHGEKRMILAIVSYSQPPLYVETFTAAASLYAADHGTMIRADSLEAIQSATDISSARPKKTGSHYPVFYALTHPKKFGSLHCHASQYARQVLSEIFQEIATGRLVARYRFYEHVVAVRDVLMALFTSGWQPETTGATDKDALLAAVHRDAFYGLIDKDLARKVTFFEELLQGEIDPGQIQRQRAGGGGGGRRGAAKRDEWHAARVTELARLASQPRVPRQRTSRELSSRDTMGDGGLRELGLQARPVADSHGANEEASETLILQGQTPSQQTPIDDRRLIRVWLAGAPTTSLKSSTDLARLTEDQVAQVMSSPMTPACQLFASLLLSTGLPPARLARIEVQEAASIEALIANGDDRPYWLPKHGVMVYRLLDGPVARESSPTATWVILALPASLAEVLTNLEPSFPRWPFHGVRASLNQQLRRLFADTPGITPTAHRLSASSWLYRRPHARDDVAAAFLSGQFGLGLAAPAAYRRISRTEHQEIFEQALRKLGWSVPSSPPRPNSSVLPLRHDVAMAGSGVAQPAESFAEVFGWLRDAMQDPSAELSGWWPGEPIPLTAVATLHQLVSAHELLAWHLATGARPIGPNSQHCLAGELQWVCDKASAVGRESRVIPLLTAISNSLQAYHSWTQAILIRVNQGRRLEDQRSETCQTPHWMAPSRRGRAVIVRNMRWQDIADLPPLVGWAPNVCRHSTASWLRKHCPDALVDHLLGHTRHGRMLSSPRTEASLGQQHALRRALTDWLSQCGYRPLNWSHMPWR